MVNKEELISFETEIGNTFNEGKIKAPIHLYSDNEDEMIEVFKDIDIENETDYKKMSLGKLRQIVSDKSLSTVADVSKLKKAEILKLLSVENV